MRLIDADLIDEMLKDEENKTIVNLVHCVVDNWPTYARQRSYCSHWVREMWPREITNKYGSYRCAHCNGMVPFRTRFCPECGLRMDVFEEWEDGDAKEAEAFFRKIKECKDERWLRRTEE